MSRFAVFVLFLTLGLEIQLSHATEVLINNKDKELCLYANLMLNFSVTYEVVGNENQTVEFELPANVTTEGSLCDNTSSTLKLNFGNGHSWTMAFSMKEKTYQADSVVFAYNLSDSTTFPNATSTETLTVTVKPSITSVGMDTCYSCESEEVLQAGAVSQTLWNALIQAFVSNGSKSEAVTSCAADLNTTTVAPTTPVTNTTTAAPVTNTTTAAPVPTTTPTPALPTPATGQYSLAPDVNSTACLLVDFGLRIGFKQGEKYQEMNLEPNGTAVSGSCGTNSSDLVLTSDTITIVLSFTTDAKKFHLRALNVTAKPSSGVVFTEANGTLSLWEAAVGSSYMCNKQQNYNITNLLTLYTFELRVQPFGVKKGVFSTAHECSMDDTNILIPIIVGAALAVLILIVVIAYVIGRRKTYVGYQTL